MKSVVTAGALFCAVLAGVNQVWSEDGENQPRSLLHEHPTLLNMLKRSNELRKQVGLRPHRMSPELTKAAQDQANYMAQTGSFSHYNNGGPNGRAQRHRFFGGGVLENIAVGQGNVPHVFSTWRNSGGHWASITSNTNEAGFGYAVGPGGTPYWVAVYGTGTSKVETASADEPAPNAEAAEPAPKAEAVAASPATSETYSASSNSGRRHILRRR